LDSKKTGLISRASGRTTLSDTFDDIPTTHVTPGQVTVGGKIFSRGPPSLEEPVDYSDSLLVKTFPEVDTTLESLRASIKARDDQGRTVGKKVSLEETHHEGPRHSEEAIQKLNTVRVKETIQESGPQSLEGEIRRELGLLYGNEDSRRKLFGLSFRRRGSDLEQEVRKELELLRLSHSPDTI